VEVGREQPLKASRVSAALQAQRLTLGGRGNGDLLVSRGLSSALVHMAMLAAGSRSGLRFRQGRRPACRSMGEYLAHAFGPWTEDFARQQHGSWLRAGRAQAVTMGDQVIGAPDIEWQPDAAVLSRLEIGPEFQGRGVGSAIVESAERLLTAITQPSRPPRMAVTVARRGSRGVCPARSSAALLAGNCPLRQEDLPNSELRDGHCVAWQTYLPRLAIRLAGGDPGPDPHS
jgi:GNAT superfamily N-acetyltransferase